MTVKTRRRVFGAIIVAALALPTESVLLRTLSASSTAEAAESWAQSLSVEQEVWAAANVESFSFEYRRAILASLPPEQRSVVWRKHLRTYRDGHPDLDAAQVAVLDEAIDLASPETFEHPTAATRAEVARVGSNVQLLLGRDAAEFLLYRLGPRDGEFVSIEPIGEKLANAIRSWSIAMARDADCDCSSNFGCGLGMTCDTSTGCRVDDDWPACGWLWLQDCDGNCRIGLPQSGG